MPLRAKKIIGSLAIFLIMIGWLVLTVSISGFVPRHWLAELLFYAIMGLGWCLPVMPVLTWMEAVRTKR
ncbi:MAG: DUF2842 domain-containing protein [Caulobacteraceae bacterium]|nr:MAG: DUF2842 domain-containing protein [Caulobacteraceae bacterium]